MQPKKSTQFAGHAILMALLSLGLLVGSCKNYLDVQPPATPSDATFFNSASNATLAVNGIYNVLRKSEFNDGLFPMLDIMSDDGRKGSNPGDAASDIGFGYDQFGHDANWANTKAWYFALFLGVRRSNLCLERIPAVAMDDALKNRLLAESHFLRALFYLDLARGFGNVPNITASTQTSATQVTQDSGLVIYDQIIKPDLQFAIANLPAAYTASGDVGRATLGAAHALLARAALYYKEFELARDEAEACISTGKYSLMPDFRDASSAAGNFGPESVFEVGAIGNEPGYDAVTATSIDKGGNQWGNVQGVRTSPNKGWGFNRPSVDLMREFEAGDVRKQKGIIYLNEELNGIVIKGDGATPDFTLGQNPYTLVDNDTLEYETYNEKVWTPGDNVPSAFAAHRRLIRYADVLLMAAEGHIRTNDNPHRAVELINMVRARAREGQVGVLPDVAETDDLLPKLLHERRVELFLEGHRYFDLIRTGRLTERLVPLGATARNRFLPIPQSEIDIAGGSIKQNPGY